MLSDDPSALDALAFSIYKTYKDTIVPFWVAEMGHSYSPPELNTSSIVKSTTKKRKALELEYLKWDQGRKEKCV